MSSICSALFLPLPLIVLLCAQKRFRAQASYPSVQSLCRSLSATCDFQFLLRRMHRLRPFHADMLAPICRSGAGFEKSEERRFDQKTSAHGAGIKISSCAMPFASPKSLFVSKQEKFYPRCTPRLNGPQSRDTPPKRDNGIANEKDWGFDLLNENVNEFGSNEDGSTWFRESGQDLGENGYICRWTRMGGRSNDGSSEWTETWWEKSDWTGYKELGGRNREAFLQSW